MQVSEDKIKAEIEKMINTINSSTVNNDIIRAVVGRDVLRDILNNKFSEESE